MSKLCNQVHLLFSSKQAIQFPFNPAKFPENGIYVLFENGEEAHGAKRIVRVGTNAGDGHLRLRLRQHFMQDSKDRSGFRKMIGSAILQRESDLFLTQWELDSTTKEAKENASPVDIKRLEEVEKLVTEYMQKHFQISVIEVKEKEDRVDLESKIISTISRCEECKPSANWLGLYSPREKIRESGLWLTNELYKTQLTQSDIQKLKTYSVIK
jgi:hypothetical protein